VASGPVTPGGPCGPVALVPVGPVAPVTPLMCMFTLPRSRALDFCLRRCHRVHHARVRVATPESLTADIKCGVRAWLSAALRPASANDQASVRTSPQEPHDGLPHCLCPNESRSIRSTSATWNEADVFAMPTYQSTSISARRRNKFVGSTWLVMISSVYLRRAIMRRLLSFTFGGSQQRPGPIVQRLRGGYRLHSSSSFLRMSGA
jgi:hypothetical protein